MELETFYSFLSFFFFFLTEQPLCPLSLLIFSLLFLSLNPSEIEYWYVSWYRSETGSRWCRSRWSCRIVWQFYRSETKCYCPVLLFEFAVLHLAGFFNFYYYYFFKFRLRNSLSAVVCNLRQKVLFVFW